MYSLKHEASISQSWRAKHMSEFSIASDRRTARRIETHVHRLLQRRASGQTNTNIRALSVILYETEQEFPRKRSTGEVLVSVDEPGRRKVEGQLEANENEMLKNETHSPTSQAILRFSTR